MKNAFTKKKLKKSNNNNKNELQSSWLTGTLRRELKREVNVLKKLFTRIKKKKERRAALVTGKLPKLGNSYNLLGEACYEASLPIFFFCSLNYTNKYKDYFVPWAGLFGNRSRRRQNFFGSCAKTNFKNAKQTNGKKNQVVNYNKWYDSLRHCIII